MADETRGMEEFLGWQKMNKKRLERTVERDYRGAKGKEALTAEEIPI